MGYLEFGNYSGNPRDATPVARKGKGEPIGFITYHDKWKCWVFEPDDDTIYSLDCLKEICDYIEKLPKV